MRRILAIFLSLVIVLAVFPAVGNGASTVTVNSSTDFQNAVQASNPAYLKLGADLKALRYFVVPQGRTVYLDLNGHSIIGPSQDATAILMNGTLQVSDSAGNGYIREIAGYEGSRLILKSGKIIGEGSQSGVRTYGDFTMNGGTVYSKSCAAVDVETNGTVNITGGLLSSESRTQAALYVCRGVVNISGGTISSSFRGIWISGPYAKVNVTGGTVSSIFEDNGGSAISPPKKMTLSKTKLTYNGKYQRPSITVYDAVGEIIPSSYYTASYTGNKNVGTASVTVKFRSPYSGSLKKTYQIIPKNTSIKKLSALKKGMTVRWYRKTTQVTGYQIRYSTTAAMTKYKKVTVSNNKTISKKIKKLSSEKKYYVKIRTYKKAGSKYYYGNWSKVKSIKTK